MAPKTIKGPARMLGGSARPIWQFHITQYGLFRRAGIGRGAMGSRFQADTYGQWPLRLGLSYRLPPYAGVVLRSWLVGSIFTDDWRFVRIFVCLSVNPLLKEVYSLFQRGYPFFYSPPSRGPIPRSVWFNSRGWSWRRSRFVNRRARHCLTRRGVIRPVQGRHSW